MNFGTLRQIGRKACGGLLAVLAAMAMSAGADAQDKADTAQGASDKAQGAADAASDPPVPGKD